MIWTHSERRAHPDLSPEELAWRVTRRMQGDRGLGEPFGRARAVACQEVEEK